MVLVCNALKQCDCRIYTNFFLVYLIQNYTLDSALQTGVRVLLHVQAQLQQRHEAVDEGAPWKAHAPRTRSRLLRPRPRPHHSRRRRCVYKYYFRLLGGLTQQHTHTNDDDYDEAVAEAAVAAAVIRIRPWKARLIAALWRHQ